LWRSDGTVAGTFQVADIAPGGGSAIEEGAPFVVADGRLFFPASSPGLGRELWSSDGTALGTQLVQDVALGPASSDPGELTLAGTNLFFTADDGTTGVELWALPLTSSSLTAKRR
jgi:ELWxxDGT repeat protein